MEGGKKTLFLTFPNVLEFQTFLKPALLSEHKQVSIYSKISQIVGMDIRDIVFTVWAANGQDVTRTIAALLAIASSQVVVVQRGGRRLASSTVGGETYQFEIPYGLGPLDVLAMIRESWAVIEDYTDDELLVWLKQRQTIGSRLDFSAVAQ